MRAKRKVFTLMAAVLCMLWSVMLPVRAQEEQIIVYAQVPADWEAPCVWAWADDGTNAFQAWPGGVMTADVNNDGWYYSYVPKATGGNIIINANEGGIQTADYKTDSESVWLIITDAETVEVSKDQLTEGALPDYVEVISDTPDVSKEGLSDEEMIKVYAKVPSDWLMPCLWAWSAPDGTNVFANWPGQELTQEGDWYTYEVPAWVNSIIVNGNLGSVQTTDISIDAMDAWVVVEDADTYYLYYEEPGDEEAAIPDSAAEDTGSGEAGNLADGMEEEDQESPGSMGIIVAVVVGAVIVIVGVGIILYRKKTRG